MNAVVVMAFGLTVLLALVTNRDLFSPAKLFLFSFMAFHVGGLLQPVPTELWLLVLLLLAVGLLTAVFETAQALPYGSAPGASGLVPQAADTRFFMAVWLLSMPGLLAQVYMVQLFGGIEGYVNSLGFRVLEWRGLGWAKTLTSMLLPANLAYFAVGLTQPRSHRWWAAYGLHFLLLMAVGLLSGSRSGILNVFALQLFCYHYIRRPISLQRAVSVGVGLMFSALVLGVVREGVKLDGGTLTTGLDGSDTAFKIATFYYGIDPLLLLLDGELQPLAYGSTLVSLVTNAVPRDWWPDKPDTGGVYFTKLYTGDAWDGASNLTPTFMGEWVINFGWTAGLLLFVLAYPSIMFFVVHLYRRTVAALRPRPTALSAIDFLVYLSIMWSVVALMTGEVTNVLLNMVLTQWIPLAMMRAVVRRLPTRHAAAAGAG